MMTEKVQDSVTDLSYKDSKMKYFLKSGERKTVAIGVCTICNCKFMNHRSFLNHMTSHKIDEINNDAKTKQHRVEDLISKEVISRNIRPTIVQRPEPKCSLHDNEIELCRFICECAIPINIIKKEQFQKLLKNSNYPTMSKAKCRTLIIKYADYLNDLAYYDLHGKAASVITDGGSLKNRKFYVIATLTQNKAYFLDLIEAPKLIIVHYLHILNLFFEN